jgi:outer membrane protein assembly factor BamB
MQMLDRVLRVAVCGVAVVSLIAGAADARGASGSKAYWPQWRGAGRDDVATDKGLLQEWPEGGPALVWTGNKLGDGYSSVVIDDGRIYTTGDRKDGEYLICLRDSNGKEIWAKRIGDAWKDGGARSTPAVAAGNRERGGGE